MKPPFRGGVLALLGYILSPLSWWNDAFVNLPIAYLFATVVSLLSRRLFGPAFVAGYWLTNVIGLWLLARGASELADRYRPRQVRQMWLSLGIATGYTIAALCLVRFGLLRPFF